MALRVNPDVAAETHPYISTGLHKHKFGVPLGDAKSLYAKASSARYLKVSGVSVHIGSQITDVAPFGEAMARVAELVRELRSDGHRIDYVDAGGGLGITYEKPDSGDFRVSVAAYARALVTPLRGLDVRLLLEPGRSIVGPAGVLLTTVIYKKRNNGKQFVVVDAAMNDLIRPALYGAYHEIVPVTQSASPTSKSEVLDIVGPVCETGDFFARDRELAPIDEGDLLAILDAGAYGMVLASNYNTRPRPAEVLVSGKSAKIIRKRERTCRTCCGVNSRSAWCCERGQKSNAQICRSPHFSLVRSTWKKSVPVRNKFTLCSDRRHLTRSPSRKSSPG